VNRAAERGINDAELLLKAADALHLAPAQSIWTELVSHLARALAVDWVFIAKFLPASETKGRTLAAWYRGRPAEDFEYELNNQFNDLGAQAAVVYASGAGGHVHNAWLKRARAEAYGHVKLVGSLGQAWGVLALAHSAALESPSKVEAMLRIYAFKASVELEREIGDERFYGQLVQNLRQQTTR
jgi:hypothetical protein